MLRTITIAAALLLTGGVSLAQPPITGAGTGNSPTDPSASSGSRMIGNAPIGHRQPRRNPELEASETARDPADVALDRKIRSICRGC